LRARREGAVAKGDAVEAFVRPESIVVARDRAELPASAQRFNGEVESLLFDGANSAVLVREAATRIEFRIALPQTGRFADLVHGERVAFGFEPARAVCFRAAVP
jgi:spermidine/putrescine transport system ATP-binding protein